MLKTVLILLILITQNVFAQSLEQKTVNLLKSFLPQGKSDLKIRGVFYNTQEPCYLYLKTYFTPATQLTPASEEAVINLSSIKMQQMAQFDILASQPQPQNIRVREFVNNTQKAFAVRLARENNQYAPWETATLDILKGPQNTLKGVYILVQYGQTKHAEMRCMFQ